MTLLGVVGIRVCRLALDCCLIKCSHGGSVSTVERLGVCSSEIIDVWECLAEVSAVLAVLASAKKLESDILVVWVAVVVFNYWSL